MRWPGRPDEARVQPESPAKLPAGMSVRTERGESVLAAAQDDSSGDWLVLTTYRFLVVARVGADAGVRLDRPWHDVATGMWDPESSTLSLTWVGGARATQWLLRRSTGPGRIPQVFRERVSASVVHVREVTLDKRRTARVSIRSVLATRELVDQVVLGPGVGTADPELAREIDRARTEARQAVGLPAVSTGRQQRGDS